MTRTSAGHYLHLTVTVAVTMECALLAGVSSVLFRAQGVPLPLHAITCEGQASALLTPTLLQICCQNMTTELPIAPLYQRLLFGTIEVCDQ